MFVISSTKIGRVLQVALGRAYPLEIKLRRRDVAGERQALAGRIPACNLPRQLLDLGRTCAFAGTAQSMTPRIACDPGLAGRSPAWCGLESRVLGPRALGPRVLGPHALPRMGPIGHDPGDTGHYNCFAFCFNDTTSRPPPDSRMEYCS